MRRKRILFVGETCVVHSTENKGYDSFSSTRYAMAFRVMNAVLSNIDVDVVHLPCHLVPFDFPNSLGALQKFDAVFFSDCGANTFLLHPDTLRLCKRTVNLLKLVKKYVEDGGGFCMVGGYMSYQGIEAKAKFKDSVIEEILPVELLAYDDRCEVPEGAELTVENAEHPIMEGLPSELPFVLGYNRTILKQGADLIVSHEGHPLIAARDFGKGRTVAYTTDCAPHWAPPQMYEWEYYPKLWQNIIDWLVVERENQ